MISERAASFRKISRPSSRRRSSVRLRLLRLTVACAYPICLSCPGSAGGMRRATSPSCASTLIDVGAKVGEHARAHRSGPARGGVDHANAVERAGQVAPRVAIELGFFHCALPPRRSNRTAGRAAFDKRGSGAPASRLASLSTMAEQQFYRRHPWRDRQPRANARAQARADDELSRRELGSSRRPSCARRKFRGLPAARGQGGNRARRRDRPPARIEQHGRRSHTCRRSTRAG